MGNESNSTKETEFVFRRLEEALRLFGRETDARWFWVIVLGLVLAAGFTYVIWMYRRDSRSVGWPWAAFLAALRCAVYVVLASVFLLPAEQTWERTETRSRVLLVPDVSGSTSTKDDLPTETMPADKLLTRQDKFIQFLTDERIGFLKSLLEKNPVHMYRFGSRIDEDFKVLAADKPWSTEEWNTWLKPDAKESMSKDLDEEAKAKFQKRLELQQQLVNGTNLSGSLLEVVNHESNNMLQGIIVVSDGRSTQSSSQSFEELRARARRAKVPIFTIVVGEHRQPITIRITDLQAPKQTRPDDKFPVRLEVDGDGLPDQQTTAYLDVTNPKGETRTVEKPFKFNTGSGGPPHAQVEFDIDAAVMGTAPAPGRRPELEEGEWKFRARIPKDKREVFLEKEHIKDKVSVHVIKKPLRVLLFAGSATHDYQFLRSLLVRETDQHRAELSIYLQLQKEGVVQDVPPDRFLKHFPDRLAGESEGKAEDRYYNLSEYDLIVAFDPDWSQLQPEQIAALEKWVNQQAGGLIVVAGPVNTYQLARLGNRDKLKPILDLFPVVLQDSVLEGLIGRPTTDPWRLHFPGATADMEFLKLDDDAKEQLSGWEEFFTGKAKGEETKDAPVVHGFYSYYPVDGVKPSATVVATFADPRARLRDGTKEQPYIVTMPYGSGKVVYIGSGETWRLRQCREVFHERFWMKLARYAGSGTLTRMSRRGVLVMGREFTAGQIVRLEAQLFGRDLQPLTPSAVPKIQLQPPAGVTLPATTFELTARKREGDEWGGWFQGRFPVLSAGDYRLELQIPETGDVLTERFTVKESNPELDNTRPDFGQMYQLASEVTEVLPRMDKAAQEELKRTLEGTAARLLQQVDEKNGEPAKGEKAAKPADRKPNEAENKEVPRLFFDLNSARLIPKCMVTDSKVQRSRGPVKDLWDEGFTLSSQPRLQLATVLLVVTILLSIEWLTRKLLKLA